MSLLIKALEKAEQGKKTEAKNSPSPGDELTLESVSVSFNPDDDEFSLGPTDAPINPQQQAAHIRSAQRGPAKLATKTWFFTGIGILAVLLLGLGLYLYLQSLSQPELVVAHTEPPVQVQTEPAPLAPVASSLGNVIKNETEVNSSTNEPVKQEPLATIEPSTTAFNDGPKLSGSPLAANKRSTESVQMFGAPIEASPDTTVKITRNKTVEAVPPALSLAYQALVAGDDVVALRNYRAVLQSDGRNVDAMLGLAALATRQGKTLEAQNWYGKVLEIEPRNSTANTAMIELNNQADPVSSESRLKTMLAQHPEAAYLHAALGDLYAGQSLWPAAQQAYFQAYHFQPEDPHYAFNLAVSLDQMGKQALALQYYQQSLALLDKNRVSDLDRAQIEARIVQLQQ